MKLWVAFRYAVSDYDKRALQNITSNDMDWSPQKVMKLLNIQLYNKYYRFNCLQINVLQ